MFLKISKLVSRNTEYFENISKKNQIHQHFFILFPLNPREKFLKKYYYQACTTIT